MYCGWILQSCDSLLDYLRIDIDVRRSNSLTVPFATFKPFSAFTLHATAINSDFVHCCSSVEVSHRIWTGS